MASVLYFFNTENHEALVSPLLYPIIIWYMAAKSKSYPIAIESLFAIITCNVMEPG